MNQVKNILTSSSWKTSNAFKNIGNKKTQTQYYLENNSTEEVMKLACLESKPFGSEVEKIIREILTLTNRTSTQNDATFNSKKIEIKAARYWAGKDNCKWQHLESNHDYNYVLFVLLDFTGFKIWGIKKTTLMKDLVDKKIVVKQGEQGYWTDKNKIISHLTVINNIKDLENLTSDNIMEV